MRVVVNDACLLIDLIDTDLLDEYFQLDMQAYITSSVLSELEYEEYERPINSSIKAGYIILFNFNAEDQSEILNLMQTHSSRLSEPDCSCLHLAKKLNATILTCERLLTKTAKDLSIPAHGSLWVLDKLIASSIITKRTALRKLKELILINHRLPKGECNKRLRKWAPKNKD